MEKGDFEIDFTEFTDEDETFLEAVHENSDASIGRMASTSDLRQHTELSRSQIHYRIEKFEDSGLLKVERPDRENGNAPKEFRLTRGGADALKAGIFADAADPANTLDAIATHVKTLRKRVEAVELNVETDSSYSFTPRQRRAIEFYIDEHIGIRERTEMRFWEEIFPTIAAELGYPRTYDSPAQEEYLDNFEYDMLSLPEKEPPTPDPEEPTLAERVERLEDKIDELAASVDGTVSPDGVRADGGTADDD